LIPAGLQPPRRLHVRLVPSVAFITRTPDFFVVCNSLLQLAVPLIVPYPIFLFNCSERLMPPLAPIPITEEERLGDLKVDETIGDESSVARTLTLMPWSSFTTRACLTATTDPMGAENPNACEPKKSKETLDSLESAITIFLVTNNMSTGSTTTVISRCFAAIDRISRNIVHGDNVWLST
jgi:hypothetical protein